jgi:hypothetical protein
MKTDTKVMAVSEWLLITCMAIAIGTAFGIIAITDHLLEIIVYSILILWTYGHLQEAIEMFLNE